MRVVGNAQLIGDGEQQRAGFGYGFVFPVLLDQCIRLGRIAAAEDRPRPLVDESDLVLSLTLVSEIGPVAIVDQGEDAAADGDAWLSSMACLLPGGAVGPDLGGLLQVEGLACFVVLERRALQVHPEFRGPYRRGIRPGPPPDAVAQAFGMGFEPEQAGWIWKHRTRIGWREALAAQQVEEDLRMTPPHVGVGLALGRLITEITPSIDHLLGRAAADTELQAPACDEIGGTGVLGHVERVLVAHVDHGRADLDPAGIRPDRRQERQGRGELAREFMHPEIAPSAPSSSAATASSMDCSSVSAAERACDCDEGVQCPNERNPIFFMRAI